MIIIRIYVISPILRYTKWGISH